MTVSGKFLALGLLALFLMGSGPAGGDQPEETLNGHAEKIDLNTADAKTLETLPGIGPGKAFAIIQHREANGPFSSVEELDEIPGLGPHVLEQLKERVTVDQKERITVDQQDTP